MCGQTYQQHARNIAIFLIVYSSIGLLLTIVLTIEGALPEENQSADDVKAQGKVLETTTAKPITPQSISGLNIGAVLTVWIYSIAVVAANSLLLFGTLKKKRGIIKLWLAFAMFQIIYYLACVCVLVVFVAIARGTLEGDIMQDKSNTVSEFFAEIFVILFGVTAFYPMWITFSLTAVFFSIFTLTMIAFWVVVFMFYRDISKEDGYKPDGKKTPEEIKTADVKEELQKTHF